MFLQKLTVSISPNELVGGTGIVPSSLSPYDSSLFQSVPSSNGTLHSNKCLLTVVEQKSSEYKQAAIKKPLRQFFLHYISAIAQ